MIVHNCGESIHWFRTSRRWLTIVQPFSNTCHPLLKIHKLLDASRDRTNTTRWPDAVPILARRRRRRAKIETTLGQRLVVYRMIQFLFDIGPKEQTLVHHRHRMLPWVWHTLFAKLSRSLLTSVWNICSYRPRDLSTTRHVLRSISKRLMAFRWWHYFGTAQLII